MDTLVYPFLQHLPFYTPGDPTYGRYTLDVSKKQKELEADPKLQVRQRRIFFNNSRFLGGEDVQLTEDEVLRGKGQKWIYYKVWQKGPWNGCDIIALHSLYSYGGLWAAHISGLLSKGFRVIAPDLPAHGRSTGLHTYIPTHTQLVDALEAVILDMDNYSDPKRKIFLLGCSMGGGIILNFCTLRPGRKRIAGVYLFCPMIQVSPETLPNPLIRLLGQMTKFLVGPYPIVPIITGKVTDDPEFKKNKSNLRTYNGRMRVATGMSMLQCMLELTPSVIASLDLPCFVVHGTRDRVTSYKASIAFHHRLASKDKGIMLYQGVEHLMLKANGDKTTQKILYDMEEWFVKRV